MPELVVGWDSAVEVGAVVRSPPLNVALEEVFEVGDGVGSRSSETV